MEFIEYVKVCEKLEKSEEGTKRNEPRSNLNDVSLGEAFNLARCYLIRRVSLCLEAVFIPFLFCIRNKLLNLSSYYTVASCSSQFLGVSRFVTGGQEGREVAQLHHG